MDKLVKRNIDNQQVAIILKNIVFMKNFKQERSSFRKIFINPAQILRDMTGFGFNPINDDMESYTNILIAG